MVELLPPDGRAPPPISKAHRLPLKPFPLSHPFGSVNVSPSLPAAEGSKVTSWSPAVAATGQPQVYLLLARTLTGHRFSFSDQKQLKKLQLRLGVLVIFHVFQLLNESVAVTL